MKFKDKYPDTKVDDDIYPRSSVFLSPIEGKCIICGEPTAFVEINYQGYYCSEECVTEEDRLYMEACKGLSTKENIDEWY